MSGLTNTVEPVKINCGITSSVSEANGRMLFGQILVTSINDAGKTLITHG
jgi:hypothetical protein